MEINLNEKRKKGRPKKNLQIIKTDVANATIETVNTNQIVGQEDEKKKRGRKKKEVVEEEVKIKKKRGRKAALKYFSSSIRKQIPLKTNIVDNENSILFLDIKESNDNTTFTYDSFDTKSQFDDTKLELNDFDNNVNEINFDNNFNLSNHVMTKSNTVSFDDTLSCNTKSQNSKTSEYDNQITIQKDNIKKGFFKILNQFDNWVEKTNVKCWWCCHNFDTVPLGMPVYYNHKIKKFSVRGVFCSFSCMLSYSNNTTGIIPKKYLINYLYKKLTGVFGINFKEAPSKYTLKEFGGLLSIEEFRKLSTENKSYKMIEYPMYISRDFIAEVDLVNIKQVNNRVFNNFSKVIELDDKKVEDAKYRISKIENNNIQLSNTIEDFIKN
jgi:hypothetical protein